MAIAISASEFIARFFGSRSTGNVCLASYANDRSESDKYPPKEIFTRNGETVEEFVRRYDKSGRGGFFGVNTVVPKAKRRNKDNIAEITCLHSDLDFKNIAVSREEIESILAGLPLPASFVVFSGHGLHCYWLLKDGLQCTPEVRERTERALQRLAWLLAGDPAVGEISRVLRLPGSHNSKLGEWVSVEVIQETKVFYTMEQLEEWLAGEAIPLLPSVGKGKTKAKMNGHTDPYEQMAREQVIEEPIDVEERLAQMQYQGPDDSSVHATQRDVTASLISIGADPDEIVAYVLQATEKLGMDWNWKQEERKIRGLCVGWYVKHPDLLPEEPPPWLRSDGRIRDSYKAEQPKPKEEKKKPVADIQVISLPELEDIEAAVPEWIVQDFVMKDVINGLFGDGGTGKDWILLQLAISMAAEHHWLGLDVTPGRVLYFNVEDQLKHIRWRQSRVAMHYQIDCRQLTDRMLIAPMVGRDTILAAYDGRKGLVQPTPVFDAMRRLLDAFKPDLIIVGNRVNIFGINQNDDAQARQCINLLNSLIMDYNTTIIMPSHVSKSGMADESGTSGTVQWSNGVRHRSLLRMATDKEEEEPSERERNKRILEVKKTNWSAVGLRHMLHWGDPGLFIGDDEGFVTTKKPEASREERDAASDRDFMFLLKKALTMKWKLSPQIRARNNIAKMLSEMPGSKHNNDRGRRTLWMAFERALAKGLVSVVHYGAPSDHTYMVVLPDNVIQGKFPKKEGSE